MPSLSTLLSRHADLEPHEVEWLHALVGDWQLLADLSFADLVLWSPILDDDQQRWVTLAHCRPSTGRTVFPEDVVGRQVPPARVPPGAWDVMANDVLHRGKNTHWIDGAPVRQDCVPVVCDGRTLAVLVVYHIMDVTRSPSRLEVAYRLCSDDILTMLCEGEYPHAGAPSGPRQGAPRVGDGLIRVDRDGAVQFASPNALSALRRMGYTTEVVGKSLTSIVIPLLEDDSADETLPLVLSGSAPWRNDVSGQGTTVLSLRALPIISRHERVGGIVLVRDISQLRRQEKELMTKDATIREVHHRVKNNLQTVAALLRMQARRTPSRTAQGALEIAMRRVATIAAVHEILSEGFGEEVGFDHVADQVMALAADVAHGENGVSVVRQGDFGTMVAADATPLALVLNEVVTNAVRHGVAAGGTVVVEASRSGSTLRIEIRDDGVGLPETFNPDSAGLGTQIVRSLVTGDLQGDITWSRPAAGGTTVLLDLTLRPLVSQR